MSYSTPGIVQKAEIRLNGLNQNITTEELTKFFSVGVRVLGVYLHPQGENQTQWAQVWVGNEQDAQTCLNLKSHLAKSGITVSRAPTGGPGWITPDSLPFLARAPSIPVTPSVPATPISFSHLGARTDQEALGYRHLDPHGPLPRNLYIMGVPLDMTQVQFKQLFIPFGMVEHSTLLSQLDGMGRRRGFILMSTHREAIEAMQAMNGKWIDGGKIDVSWALVQRETKQFGPGAYGAMPNRVLHPPTVPTRKEPPLESSVIVDNLEPTLFPNAGAIKEIFSHFGPVLRVTVLTCTTVIPGNTLQALVQFEHPISARALIGSNGMMLGGRSVQTRSMIPQAQSSSVPPPPQFKFDPFDQEMQDNKGIEPLVVTFNQSPGTILKADTEPFTPSRILRQEATSSSDESVSNDIGSSQSEESKRSGEKVPPIGSLIDRWHRSAVCCE